MAPRKDDEEPTNVMVNDPPSPGSPTSQLTHQLMEKSLSFDVLDLSYPVEDDMDMSRVSLASSFKRLSDRSIELKERVDRSLEVSNNSIIIDACRRSLIADLSSMLNEARLLLEHLGTGGDCFLTMITPWRVSLSQIRALSYLDTIETALEYPSRDTLDSELLAIWNSMDSDSENANAEIAFRISPWTMPSLSFDLTVGSPVSHTLQPSISRDATQCLPLKVNVWAIVELLASDIANGKATGNKLPACAVSVESCVHETHKYGSGAGIYGDAFVRVKLYPIGDGQSKTVKRWGFEKDVDNAMQVKEARCVQANAFPPKPQANVDLFTTAVLGERGISMSLCFQTFKTMNDEVPEINLELVVG